MSLPMAALVPGLTGTEGSGVLEEDAVLAKVDLVAVLQDAGRHLPPADVRAVEALEVFHDEDGSRRVAIDAQMVARDARIVEHDGVGLQPTDGHGVGTQRDAGDLGAVLEDVKRGHGSNLPPCSGFCIPAESIFRRHMVRSGTIIGLATGVLLLGAAGAGLWYWSHQSAPASSLARTGTAPTGAESDSVLARHVRDLHDSLESVDSALREAQISEAEVPPELVQRQAGLWERYTWARTRLSEAIDAAHPDSARPVAVASPAPPPPEASGSELSAMLGNLATWLWVIAGLGAFAVAVLAWLLLFRRPAPAPSRPLTEPTIRMDRNVRLPVSDPTSSREPTYTQMRQAQARAAAPRPPEEEEYDDAPAAPLPRTGRHAWENTVSQPQPQMAPSEPTAVQDYVVSMAKRGRTPAEIARRLRIPQDQVDLILRLRRNA